MKTKKLNTTLLWKQSTDVLFPRLRLSVNDRVVYFHLLRYTRLEGKRQIHCSMPQLSQGIGLSARPIRDAVRRLAVVGLLRLVQRTKAGHVLEVRLPDEIRGARTRGIPMGCSRKSARTGNLEALDFLRTRALRQTIHLRERGHCFYCLRRTDARIQCLDHVVPLAKNGQNSYRNLVSCCLECNSMKGERPAKDLLRRLYRESRLTTTELRGRLRALEALEAGKLQPPVEDADIPIGTRSRPRIL